MKTLSVMQALKSRTIWATVLMAALQAWKTFGPMQHQLSQADTTQITLILAAAAAYFRISPQQGAPETTDVTYHPPVDEPRDEMDAAAVLKLTPEEVIFVNKIRSQNAQAKEKPFANPV